MEIQCQGTTKAGARCKKAATAFSDFCVQHRAAVNAAEVVELPELTSREHGVGTIYQVPPLPESGDDDGSVWAETAAGAEFVAEAAKPPGFANRHPKQRCRERSCFKVRGHEGRHENGSASVLTCAAKDCRLTIGHSGPHGQEAKARARIGELTGKL